MWLTSNSSSRQRVSPATTYGAGWSGRRPSRPVGRRTTPLAPSSRNRVATGPMRLAPTFGKPSARAVGARPDRQLAGQVATDHLAVAGRGQQAVEDRRRQLRGPDRLEGRGGRVVAARDEEGHAAGGRRPRATTGSRARPRRRPPRSSAAGRTGRAPGVAGGAHRRLEVGSGPTGFVLEDSARHCRRCFRSARPTGSLLALDGAQLPRRLHIRRVGARVKRLDVSEIGPVALDRLRQHAGAPTLEGEYRRGGGADSGKGVGGPDGQPLCGPEPGLFGAGGWPWYRRSMAARPCPYASAASAQAPRSLAQPPHI